MSGQMEFDSERSKGEETLQMVAKLPAPEGLTDRVHRRLGEERLQARRSWWRIVSVPQLRFAAVAVVLVGLAGEGWNLYHGHALAGQNAGKTIVAPPHVTPQGGFDSAHSATVPKTLTPIHVPPAPKKKAGKVKTAGQP